MKSPRRARAEDRDSAVIERIISGGQTGADRGALDAALDLGLAHGGYCPRGRRAEDGAIPPHYQLEELDSADYAPRTEANVVAADVTLLLTRGRPTGGSALTADLARRRGRPLFHVDLEREPAPAGAIAAFLRARAPRIVNVAGPRESHCPGIGAKTRAVVVRALREVGVGGPA